MFSYINIHTHAKTLKENSDIKSIVNISTDSDISLINYPFSIAIHPWDIDSSEIPISLAKVKKTLINENCIALGECGLDRSCKTDFDLQIEIFKKQIKMSIMNKKPVIIHCVKAFSDIVQIKKDLKANQRWIIHGYRGNITIANQLIRHNCMLSFGPEILDLTTKPAKLLPQIPLSSIFLETDTKGINIENVYSAASKILNIPIKTVQDQIIENYKETFITKR